MPRGLAGAGGTGRLGERQWRREGRRSPILNRPPIEHRRQYGIEPDGPTGMIAALAGSSKTVPASK
jgi:hypothetical protein